MPNGDFINAFRWMCALFLPGPKILWASLSVAVFFTDSVYLQYFALGYYYEVFINHLAKHAEFGMLCGHPLLPHINGPCIETQLFASFFAFIAVHTLFYGRHGLPKLKTTICIVCFVALVLSLIAMGACNLLSIGYGAIVGVLTGMMRALFYRAVLRDPIIHLMGNSRHGLFECVAQFVKQSKLYGPVVIAESCEYCNRIGCNRECIDDEADIAQNNNHTNFV